MRATRTPRVCGRLACLALLAACDARERVDASSGGAALMGNLLRVGQVELVCSEESCLRAARLCAAELDRAREGYTLHAEPVRGAAARILVGTRADDVARGALERLGVLLGTRDDQPAFLVEGQAFAGAEDVLIACAEDPQRPGLPCTLYFGNDAEHLSRFVRHELVAGWKPAFQVWQGGRVALRGPLAGDGRIDGSRLERPLALRAEFELEQSLAELPARGDGLHGRSQRGCDPARIELVLSAQARARENVRAWAAPELPPLELLLLARAEDYTRLAGASEPAALEVLTRRVTLCLAPGLPEEGGAAAARAALRELLGEASARWIEDGAAVDAAGIWWGEELERWLARLVARGLGLSIAELVAADSDARISPHQLVPLRAALFRFLRETRSADELRALWGGTQRLAPDAALETAFAAALLTRTAALRPVFESAPRRVFAQVTAEGRVGWRGVESELSRGAGWSSSAGAQAIGELAERGANAYAVRAACLAREHPAALPELRSSEHFGTLEGDLELFAALATAKAHGLATLLDLDVLASPGSIEDGAWLRTRPADWKRFFDARRAALVHAGLLAELARADALSIGCGLDAVTRDQVEGRKGTQSDLEEKRRGWSEAIAAARRAFDGALCYVSDSYAEIELVLFWKELDAIGLRLDEHLEAGVAGGATAAREKLLLRMQAAFALAARTAAREKKPWFLARTACEPSSALPGGPDFGPGASDPEAQTAELETLGSALLRLQPADRPAAVFLWRQPSDPAEMPLDPGDPSLARAALIEPLRRLWRVL